MYNIHETSIISDGDAKTSARYRFQIGYNYQSTKREIYDMQDYWSKKYPEKQFEGFDQWRNLLNREEEFSYCKYLIDTAIQQKRKIHIANITCREVAEYLTEHYHRSGYFTDYPRKCITPYDTSHITVSIAITSLCYSEKEKNKNPYITTSYYTPIRSSSDQKYLTTMIRTGVIQQVDIAVGSETCIKKLLQEEVFSPFLLGQILHYTAIKNTMIPKEIRSIEVLLD